MTVSRLIRAIRAIVAELVAPLEYSTKVRYRVVAMADARVQLQVVKKGKWPDVLPCSIRMGVPGVRAVLTPGSIVIVEFVENDPQVPILTHFSAPGEPGFVPVSLVLGADSTTAPAAARVGDLVQGAIAPGTPVTGTLNGQPFVGTFASAVLFIGTIQTGSSKVGIAS